MRTQMVVLIVAFIVVGLLTSPRAVLASAAPTAADEAALSYSNALGHADAAASYELLSSASRASVNAQQWRDAVTAAPSARPPSSSILLKALATAEPPAAPGRIDVGADQSLVEVKNKVRITQVLVLVREGERWVVDLKASDEINARQAAELFLEAVAADSSAPPTPRPVRRAETSLPMLQVLLAPEAKDFYVLESELSGERARVTLACDLPVSVVVRTVRQGAGWIVDLARPVISTPATSPDPLRAAADEANMTACQEQLRSLARAFQMYTSASDSRFPEAATWVDQIRPFLPPGTSLHCPSEIGTGTSYAMNANLSGKNRIEVGNPANTPLLYESTLQGTNPAGTGDGWPTPSRHSQGNLVLYVDGSVRPAAVEPSFAVTEAAGVRTPPIRTAPLQPRRPPIQRPSPGAR